MSVISALPLGAPGVYERPDVALHALTNVRMDVCAFVGVAPRGPARVRWNPWRLTAAQESRAVRRSVPVRIDSWEDYRREFGGFEGPALLPYAVASFFEQGGRRAHIVRIVHDYDDERAQDGVAWGVLEGMAPAALAGLPIRARSFDPAAADITVTVQWEVTPLTVQNGYRARIELAADAAVPPGSVLRVTYSGGRAFVFVAATSRGTDHLAVALQDELPQPAVSADLVTVQLRITRGAQQEKLIGLGLSPLHPFFLAKVLRRDSRLVTPDPRWDNRNIVPAHLDLPAYPATVLGGAGPGSVAGARLAALTIRPDGLWLASRNEGSWGNALRAELSYRTQPIRLTRDGGDVLLAVNVALPPGSTLRLRYATDVYELRRVVSVDTEWGRTGSAQRVQRARLDAPLTADFAQAELVEAQLRIWEAEATPKLPKAQRAELHTGLGLTPQHPRWIARVLYEESKLVYPADEWLHVQLPLPDPALPTSVAAQFVGGTDRWADIVPNDFFDPGWTLGDEAAAAGVHALLALSDVSLLVVPDLYSPEAIAARSDVSEPRSLAGKTFAACVHTAARAADPVTDELAGLRLDPRNASDRAEIVRLQQQLVELAELQRSFIVLLDVPPGLNHTQIQRWRASFDCEFAAAYHPWLEVSRPDDERSPLINVNPAAVAAGIIAQRERAFGVQYGPANELAIGVVDAAERVAPSRHDELHPLGINVYLRERDGVRLSAARTLARRPEYRQISVRRLVSMIMRTIDQQMQWVVFEPNNAALRAEITRMLTTLLRSLHRANAFAGTTEEESFFVRCDDALNPSSVQDAGRLIVEVGIAPAEPIEFIILKIARGADNVLRVED